MNKNDIDNLDWFWIGLKFGFGFAIAGTIVGTVTLFIALKVTAVYTQQATAAAIQEMNSSIARVQSALPKPREKIKVQRTRLVDHRVPARSSEDCLLLTDGVANEQYQKCRTGYMTKRQEQYYAWE